MSAGLGVGAGALAAGDVHAQAGVAVVALQAAVAVGAGRPVSARTKVSYTLVLLPFYCSYVPDKKLPR